MAPGAPARAVTQAGPTLGHLSSGRHGEQQTSSPPCDDNHSRPVRHRWTSLPDRQPQRDRGRPRDVRAIIVAADSAIGLGHRGDRRAVCAPAAGNLIIRKGNYRSSIFILSAERLLAFLVYVHVIGLRLYWGAVIARLNPIRSV